MTKRIRVAKDTSRIDTLLEMVREAIQDNRPKRIIDELDAIQGFMARWSKDYQDEDDPRMAMITEMIGCLAQTMAFQFHFIAEKADANEHQTD